jgi:hypothetical protein
VYPDNDVTEILFAYANAPPPPPLPPLKPPPPPPPIATTFALVAPNGAVQVNVY